MEFIVSSVFNIIEEYEKNAFFGAKGKIRLFFLKRKLSKSIAEEILKKYGNESYYHDLDVFLTKHRVIYTILKNCMDASVFAYKSKGQMITYYIGLFMEECPDYRIYYEEIRLMLHRCFEVIFQTLNSSGDEETRVICNVTKELTRELEKEVQDVHDTVRGIEEKIDRLLQEERSGLTEFLSGKYREYLLYLYPEYPGDGYLERRLYTFGRPEKKEDAAGVLLSEKRVIVLGEAGFGKTYEAVTLLRALCMDERAKDLIPVYFSLQEYGLLYADIPGGIRYKIGPYCQGEPETFIEQGLKEGRFVFLFDGIDDIVEEADRAKFFAEANSFPAQYHKNYYFFTSRFNRYHRGLGDIKEYFLTRLEKDVIRRELGNEGIHIQIPENYYELLSNPFFLDVGKKVLKQNANYDIFNRSRLFQELFLQLYGGMEQRKGLSRKNVLTYAEAGGILGRFACENFDRSSWRYLEFEEKLSKLIKENRAEVIASFIASGLFRVSEQVSFVHKLLKEYFAAYYLKESCPLAENRALYQKLVSREEWKEVFIFMGGLYDDRKEQDAFLDFVMEENLPLYVECIKAKSDLCAESGGFTVKELVERLLTQIRNTYTFMVSKYFASIAEQFDPRVPKGMEEAYRGRQIGITGFLSGNGAYLDYWLDYIEDGEEAVRCIEEQDAQSCFAAFEEKAVRERRQMCSYGLHLEWSGRHGDSGRQIAIDLVKNGLKSILEKRRLIESDYLLCEQVSNAREKIGEIKNSSDFWEMLAAVDKLIEEARRIAPGISGYDYQGIELFTLREILHTLNEAGINFADYVLPGADRSYADGDIIWNWDLYSKEQKEKRVVLFFYYYALSYLDMVLKNFPELCRYFYRYQDMPYQMIIGIDHKEEEEKNSFYAEPCIQYYYVASDENEIPMPVLYECSERPTVEEEWKLFGRIQESYQKRGRIAHRISHTRTVFSKVTHSNDKNGDRPLAEQVYEAIKESLGEIFGRLS